MASPTGDLELKRSLQATPAIPVVSRVWIHNGDILGLQGENLIALATLWPSETKRPHRRTRPVEPSHGDEEVHIPPIDGQVDLFKAEPQLEQ